MEHIGKKYITNAWKCSKQVGNHYHKSENNQLTLFKLAQKEQLPVHLKQQLNVPLRAGCNTQDNKKLNQESLELNIPASYVGVV